jgi:hypothetical protein
MSQDYSLEVKELETEAVAVVAEMTGRAIRSGKDLDDANGLLKKASDYKKRVKSRLEEITGPLNVALKSTRSLFAPLVEKADEAISGLKTRMLDYDRKLQAEEAKKTAEVEAKLKSGETTLAKAGAVLERVEAKREAIPTRTVPKLVITDPNLVPDEFWVIDEVALRYAVVMERRVVPGAERVEEKIIVA